MPFRVTDKITGKTAIFENEPSEQDLIEAFGSGEQKATPPRQADNAASQVPKWGQENPDLYGAAGVAYETISPLLEALGIVGGGAAGLAGGAAGGPAGLVAGPILGAGLGYSAASRLKKAVGGALGVSPQESPVQALLNVPGEVATGAAAQMTGGIAGKLLTGAPGAVSLLDKNMSTSGVGKYLMSEPLKRNPLSGMEEEVGGIVGGLTRLKEAGKSAMSSPEVKIGNRIMKGRTSASPYTENVEKSQKLSEDLPGLDLTYGQQSNFPVAVREELKIARGTNEGAVLAKNLEEQQNKAIRNYIKDKFPTQGNIENYIDEVKQTAKTISDTETITKKALDDAMSVIGAPLREDVQRGGGVIRNILKGKKLATYKESEAMYKGIDDIDIPADDLLTSVSKIKAQAEGVGQAPRNFPTGVQRQMQGAVQEEESLLNSLVDEMFQVSGTGNIPFNQLRGFRSQAFDIADKAKGRGNYQLAKNARDVGQTIDDAMETGAEKIGSDAYGTFRAAQDFYRENYVKPFRKGTVGEVLRPGADTSGLKVADSEVAGQFFYSGKKAIERVQDFARVLGNEGEAREALKTYAEYDLRKTMNQVTGEINPTKFYTWFNKNRELLDNLGIAQNFKTIDKAQRMVDNSAALSSDFAKNAASKMLNVDIDKAISEVFTGIGSKASGQRAAELLKAAKGNSKAIGGIRTSFRDFLVDQIQLGSMDVSGTKNLSSFKIDKIVQQYAPAIKEFWKDNPQALKSWLTVQDAIKTINRNKTSQFAGSQTAELSLSEGIGSAMERTPVWGKFGALLHFGGRILKTAGKDELDRVYTKALFDPTYADALVRLAKAAQKDRSFDGTRKLIERALKLDTTSSGATEAAGRAVGTYLPASIRGLLEDEQ